MGWAVTASDGPVKWLIKCTGAWKVGGTRMGEIENRRCTSFVFSMLIKSCAFFSFSFFNVRLFIQLGSCIKVISLNFLCKFKKTQNFYLK